ncbi:hypothetical protein HYH03_010478 [Edaphochlamys debaryana]|uniref:Uncharacterized protein n=1 Tax=Edaphochlamys debaryana TaxID=47281 RepID=A0A835Y1W1_9CHLO|nr:hypothetical protein HYH03_010478 [Edaphochlamys debaryana]|eukprot:KAG2491030.1 hypothetical protein HYH03_010478 [Edaphochlamys debaryana]
MSRPTALHCRNTALSGPVHRTTRAVTTAASRGPLALTSPGTRRPLMPGRPGPASSPSPIASSLGVLAARGPGKQGSGARKALPPPRVAAMEWGGGSGVAAPLPVQASALVDILISRAQAGARADPLISACIEALTESRRLRRLQPNQLAGALASLAALGRSAAEQLVLDLDSACYLHPSFDPAATTQAMAALAALHRAAQPPPETPAATTGAEDTGAVEARPAVAAVAPTPSWRRATASAPPRSSAWGSGAAARGWARRSVDEPAPAAPPPAAPEPQAIAACTLAFPSAVHLRLSGGGFRSFSYDQLASLLKSFRALGFHLDDSLAEAVGTHMALQLLGMEAEERAEALASVCGSADEDDRACAVLYDEAGPQAGAVW